jgi:Zn-dependent protease/predicted transcriptional regulator
MKWSSKLGTFAGICVYVHATFLLLLGWIAFSHWLQYRSLAPTAVGVAFILALFACVLLHECGHALAARHFGIATRDITLLPIGGVARLERMPEQPNQELWVALAGPAVNLVIAVVLAAYLQITGHLEPLSQIGMTHGVFLERLLFANLFLVGFNMIPAFPMDGGRILRALLAKRMQYARATRIAAMIGQGAAFVFALLGLFTNPFSVFIALFVWIGAAQEAGMAQAKSLLDGVLVRDAAISDFRVVSPRDELAAVVRLVLRGCQQDFPVIDQGYVVGMLTRRDLLAALAAGQAYTSVSHCMERDFPMAEAGESLQPVLARMQQSEFDTLPVLENGRLLALLTRENVVEYVMISSALKAASESARALSPASRVEEVVAKSLVQHTSLVDSLGGTTSGVAW